MEWVGVIGLKKKQRRASLVGVSGAVFVLFLSGCSSFKEKTGLFEDKSQEYRQAESLKEPLTPAMTGGEYQQDVLYPIPKISAGQLLTETPRVKSAYIPLEHGVILLHKSEVFDRVLFAKLYEAQVLEQIPRYLKNLEIGVTEQAEVPELRDKLIETGQVEEIDEIILTEWAASEAFGYETPGFWKRLFGKKKQQHQYAFIVSKIPLANRPDGLKQYAKQLHVAHRNGKKSSPTAWQTSIDDDPLLGEEIVNYVEFLKREVALASTGQLSKLNVRLEEDGNGLPYLTISNRFALVWEILLDLLPTQKWRVEDLDRSKGLIYLEVKDDEALKKMSVSSFQLHLLEGAQMMNLMVEVSDDQPASREVGEHVLKILEERFFKKIEVEKNG